MRLIDADTFIEYLGLDAEDSREINLGGVVSLEDFDRQPTAYDVDKVVEQLRELEENEFTYARRISSALGHQTLADIIPQDKRLCKQAVQVMKGWEGNPPDYLHLYQLRKDYPSNCWLYRWDGMGRILLLNYPSSISI